MSVRTEELQLKVVIDGTPARRELAQLDQEYAKLNSEIKGLKKGTEEYIAAAGRMETIKARQSELRKEIGDTALTAKQLTDELKRLQVAQRNLTPGTAQWQENAARIEVVKNRLRELNDVNVRAAQAWEVQRKSIALTSMTMEQLEMESRRLNATLRSMDPNTAEFVRLRRELTAVDERMQALKTGLGPFGRMWQSVKGQIAGAAGVLGAMFAGSFIVDGFRNWVRSAAELSDAQADVQRTTGLTREEVNGLTRELGRMNTRTARAELLALAADAGKLGITGRDNIMQFVRAGDQIRVALGEDLGDDAIKNIGKLNQTFDVGRATGKNLEQQMLATGSAINALGQSSTAQESYLVDFTTRMAGVNKQAGINIQNTLGYGAALDQLGQRSETSSTALAQFTLKAFTDTADYAKIAGMGVEEFTALLNSDTNEALLRVLEGLQGNNEGLSRMTALFGDLGQEGARAVGVLSSLASNTKLVREQQAIANKEFAAGTSITNEFNTKNNTLAANLELIGKRLAGAFVNSGVVNAVNSVAKGIAEWLKQPVDAELQKQRMSVNALVFETMRLDEGDKKRIANIQQLKKEHPQHFANLSAETATNGELAAALDKVNQAYVKKILLARAQEDIADIESRHAEAIEEEGAAEQRANAIRDAISRQSNADQRVRFAESYDLIIEHFRKVELATQGEAARSIRFNAWMQKNGMPATLYDEVKRLASADAEYQAALDRRLAIDEEYQNEMARINRLAIMAGGSDDGGTVDGPAPEGMGEGAPGPSKEALEQAKRDLEQWRVELVDIREGIYQDGLSADEREIRQLDVQHARALARLKQNTLATEEDIRALEAKHARERADLITGQGEERAGQYSEAAAKIREVMVEAEALELEAEVNKWDELIALGEKYELDVTGLEERKQAALDAIRQKWREKEKADDQKARADRMARSKEEMQNRIANLNGMAQLAGSVTSLIDAVKAAEEQRADADGVRTKEEIDRINQLEKKRRNAALVQIAISSASGVAQAIQAGAGRPFPENLGAIAMGIAAVLSGIAQAYSILNQSNQQQSQQSAPPAQAQASGIPLGEKGGVFEGPSHADGGLKVYDPRSQRVVAEVEGGEPWMVLSKAFRRANPGALAKLMAASATGSKLHIAEHGGIFGSVPSFNFRGAHEAIRLASGGVVSAAPMAKARPGQADAASQATGRLEQLLEALLGQMSRVAEATERYPTEIQARVSNEQVQRRDTELARIQDKARGRRAVG